MWGSIHTNAVPVRGRNNGSTSTWSRRSLLATWCGFRGQGPLQEQLVLFTSDPWTSPVWEEYFKMQREEMRFRACAAVETFRWDYEARYCRNRRGKREGECLGSFWRFGGGKPFLSFGELVRWSPVSRMKSVGDGKEGGGMKKILWIVLYSMRRQVTTETQWGH